MPLSNGKFIDRNTGKEYVSYEEIQDYIERLEDALAFLEEKCAPIFARERFSDDEAQTIRQKRVEGSTCQELAQEYKCSTATIHRIVADLRIDLRKKSYRNRK